MPNASKLSIEQRMKALKAKYCQQLPEKYTEIEITWNEYQADLTNPALIETFYRLIHTLKGTAATFGFVTQADICFEIQKLLLDAKENLTTLSKSDVLTIEKYINDLKENINTPPQDIL